MGYHWALLPLGPLLLAQGLLVRRATPKLPEPPGARQGIDGSGPLLRLLIIGDSAAAGVGASHQDEALSGHLVAALSQEYHVQWQLVARTGATTTSMLHEMRELDGGPWDIAVTSLGVNDVTSGIGLRAWLKRQAELREVLVDSLGVSRLLVCGLPPMHGFPALPQPLRWYLGARATAFDAALRRDVDIADRAAFLSLRFTADVSLMAADGFHPGPGVYREWGRRSGLAISAMMKA